MSKTKDRKVSKKSTTSRLSHWYKDWKPYFKGRVRQSVSQLWTCLTMALFTVIVFVAVLYIVAPSKVPGASDMLNTAMLIVVAILFTCSFGLFLILSLHPKTRKIADRLFGFRDQTEFEELKAKVRSIESRLGSIETNLKTLTNKEREGGK